MGLSDRVETKIKRKRPHYTTHVSPSSLRKSVAAASASYPTRVNCGTHQQEAATRVDGAELRLVQNTVGISCGI